MAGGFYDHAPTPTEGIPSPDGIVAANGFTFDRLGVRIPTVAVSPRITPGTVVHAPTGASAPFPTSQYESTSIISTANKIFGISGSMTARDAWAGTFLDLVAGPAVNAGPAIPAPTLSAASIAAEASMLLNDHHLENINLLCAPEFGVASAHPACAAHGDAGAQAAFTAGLGAGEGAAAWGERGVVWPHLQGEAARLMRQRDFAPAMAALWGAYKEKMGVAA